VAITVNSFHATVIDCLAAVN